MLFEETSIAGFVNLYLTHHLANDNLKVFVVNLHTLQTVYVLDFVDDILLYGRGALNCEDVGRCDCAVGQRCTGTNIVVLLYEHLLRQRHKILTNITHLRCDDNFTVTALQLTHGYLTVNFCNDGRIRRVTSLEELSNTRQTTGDVTTTATECTRNLHEDITCLHLLTVVHHDMAVDGEVIGANEFSGFVQDVCRRNDGTIL